MSCPTISSGDQFLGSTLSYLDCAGQQLGEAGYRALSAPGSVVGQVLLASLTLFIAFQGLRLMFGQRLDWGDAAMAAVRIGLVLLLAGSWPAVRTLFHETAVRGPSELVAQMGGNRNTIVEQLQNVDSGMVALTKWGTGKLDIRAGRTAAGDPAASAFAGEATNESLGFSTGRLLFLVDVLGGLGLPLLMSGLLVSVLPLFAGLLLFDRARGLMIGWVRAWFFCVLASLTATLLLAIESAMLQPWLVRLIGERSASLATPSAPIELLAMTGAFTLILGGSLMILMRVCFAIDPMVSVAWATAKARSWMDHSEAEPIARRPALAQGSNEVSRAQQIGSALTTRVRHEQAGMTGGGMAFGQAGIGSDAGVTGTTGRSSAQSRRASQRLSRSSRKRDQI